MLERFRSFWTQLLDPITQLFIKFGVSPNIITLVGTAGVCIGAMWCFPKGLLWQGVLVITVFVFADLIDGHMARITGQTTAFGSFLDSTLDRIADAAIFVGLVLYFVGPGQLLVAADWYLYLTLFCLVAGSVTSYCRAKAESLGFAAKGGIAERADRLVLILVVTFFADLFDLPIMLLIALALLALASSYTIWVRIQMVSSQAKQVIE